MKIEKSRLRFRDGRDILFTGENGIPTVSGPADKALPAAAALLFCREPETGFTGGSLDWEYRGMHMRAEKDLSRLPVQFSCFLPEEGRSRRVSSGELPLPEGLTAETWESHLHIGKAPADARRRIINLLDSGCENVNTTEALRTAEAELVPLRAALRPDTDRQLAETEAELSDLEHRDFDEEPEAGSQEELRAELERLEQRIGALGDSCSAADRELKRKENALSHLGGKSKEKVSADLETAEKLCRQIKTYDENYGTDTASPGLLSSAALLLILAAFVCLYLMNYLIRAGLVLPAVLLFLPALLAATFFTRFSRRADAISADRKNRELLRDILKEYLPDYRPQCNLQEAGELQDYLSQVRELFDYLAGRRTELEENSRSLQELEEERVALQEQLEKQRLRREEQDRWEFLLRDAEKRRQELLPPAAENERLRREIRMRETAVSALRQAADRFAESSTPALLKTAAELLRGLGAGSIEGLLMNDPGELFAVAGHRQLPLSQLDEGNTALLYLALRVALVRQTWPEEDMPLFLDSDFAAPEQKDALLLRLRALYPGQIFLFS